MNNDDNEAAAALSAQNSIERNVNSFPDYIEPTDPSKLEQADGYVKDGGLSITITPRDTNMPALKSGEGQAGTGAAAKGEGDNSFLYNLGLAVAGGVGAGVESLKDTGIDAMASLSEMMTAGSQLEMARDVGFDRAFDPKVRKAVAAKTKETAAKIKDKTTLPEIGDPDGATTQFIKDLTAMGTTFAAAAAAGAGTGGALFVTGIAKDPAKSQSVIESFAAMSANLAEKEADPEAAAKLKELSTSISDMLGTETPTSTMAARVVNGLDEVALAKIATAAGEALGAGATKVGSIIPDSVKSAGKRSFENTKYALAYTMQKLMAGLSKDPNVRAVFDDALDPALKSFMNLEVKPTWNKAKSLEENLRESLVLRVNRNASLAGKDIKEQHKLISDELEKLGKQIASDPGGQEAFLKRAEKLAIEKNLSLDAAKSQLLDLEMLKLGTAANVMAADMLVEATYLKLSSSNAVYREAFKAAAKSGDSSALEPLFKANQEAISDYAAAISFRAQQLSPAGTALRATQESAISGDMVRTSKEKLDALNARGATLDYQGMAEFADDWRKIQQLQGQGSVVSAADDVAEAVSHTIDALFNNRIDSKKISGFMTDVYVNGILSSPKTHLLNAVSAEGMLAVRTLDNLVGSGVQAVTGRVPGASTFSSTVIAANSQARSHAEMALMAMNWLQAHAKAATGSRAAPYQARFSTALTGGNNFLERNISTVYKPKEQALPFLDSEQRESLFRSATFESIPDRVLPQSVIGTVGEAPAATTQRFLESAPGILRGEPVRKIMTATDVFFKQVAIRAEMRKGVHERVYVDDALGLGDKLSPENVSKVQQFVEQRMMEAADLTGWESQLKKMGLQNDIAAGLSRDMYRLQVSAAKKAAAEAQYITFQEELVSPVHRTMNKLIQTNLISRMIIPFYTTPVNIIDDLVYRMPVIYFGDIAGIPLHPRFYRDLAAGGETRLQAVSKLITGNLIVGLGAQLHEAGAFNAQPDKTDNVSKMMANAGIFPNGISLDSGHTWIDTTKITPTGMLMAWGAVTNRTLQNYDLGIYPEDKRRDLQQQLVAGVSNILPPALALPMLQGPANLYKAVSPLEKSGGNILREDAASTRINEFIAATAIGTVPYSSLMRFTTQMSDEQQLLRDIKTFDDQFRSISLGILDRPAPKYDGFGQPIKAANQLLGWLGPFSNSESDMNPVVRAMAKAGYAPEPMRKDFSYKGVDLKYASERNLLTTDEYETLNAYVATSHYRAYERVINSSSFNKADIITKQRMLSSATETVRQEARDKLVRSNPDLKYRLQDAKTNWMRATQGLQFNQNATISLEAP